MAKTRLELTAQLNRMKAATAAAPITPTEFADFLNDWVNYMTNDGEYSAGVLEQWKQDTLTLQNANLNANIQAAVNAATQALASAGAATAVAQGTATARPSTRATFLQDFANSRYLDPKIPFSRNSVGTYWDRYGVLKTALANKPRFQHDPVTKESLGLLFEPTATNLLTYSNDFSTTAYTKARGSIIASTIKAPDNTNAQKLIEDNTVAATHQINRGDTAVTAGTVYTGSIYICAGERTTVVLQLSGADLYGGTNPSVQIDLLTGAVSNIYNVSGYGVENCGKGWYRVSLSQVVTTSGNSGVNVLLSNNASISYNGDGASGLYVFGAQLEAGLNVTSYIPTTTTAITRDTDTINIQSNFSDYFTLSKEGTIFLSAKKSPIRTANNYKAYVKFKGPNTTGGNTIAIIDADILERVYSQVDKDGVNSLNYVASNVTAGTYFQYAFAYSPTDSKSYSNGVVGATDTQVDVPENQNQFVIGGEIATIIKQIAFWPRRVSDSALQALTTNGLFGKNPMQAPAITDLLSGAFLSPYAILRNQGRNLFKINGTGAQVTDNINLPYDFTFEILTSAGATITSTPQPVCTAGTDNLLVVTVPVGKTLWYAITPVFEY